MTRKIRVPCFDRRTFLKLTGAVAGSQLLPACETLSPPEEIEEELPSPITPNDQFYAQSCCGVPEVDPTTWSLEIVAEETPLASLDTGFLAGLELREKEHTLQCIGGGPANQQISNAVWGGLPLREILDLLGVEIPETAVGLRWTCADGYNVGVPLEDVDTMWAVWQMNGEPLPAKHGAPLRLLNPGRYGTKNPKWPVELAFVDTPHVGFWENLGWSDEAPYLPNGMIGRPRDFSIVDVGEVLIRGTAYAGSDPIVLVEITTDGGTTWQEAERYYEGGVDIWTLWRFLWRPEGPGEYEVQVRVTTASGAMSVPTHEATDRLNGYDGSMRVTVLVE